VSEVSTDARRADELKDPQEFRRESVTNAYKAEIESRIKASGALKTNGHFIHHEGTLDEFHSTVWFAAEDLFLDPGLMTQAIPSLVSTLESQVLNQVDLVAGIVTGGAVLAREVAQYIQSDRPMKDSRGISCIHLKHRKDDNGEQEYDLTNSVRAWLKRWRQEHEGRSPNCLLLDDVISSSRTTLHCIEILRAVGVPVVGMLHVASANAKLPRLLEGIPAGVLFNFDGGKTFKTKVCPMCLGRQLKTVV